MKAIRTWVVTGTLRDDEETVQVEVRETREPETVELVVDTEDGRVVVQLSREAWEALLEARFEIRWVEPAGAGG